MLIYKDEQAIEGLVDKIISNSSIAYTTEVSHWLPPEALCTLLADKRSVYADAIANIEEDMRQLKLPYVSLASITDSDLYFTRSIFVSTNWNANDDVFDRAQVWEARHTPSHKRTNLEHDEKQLVGHITDTWAIDTEGNIVPDNAVVDDLPILYHLANGAVIYTNWEDDNLLSRTKTLIEQIEAGTKYVSMEALFGGFDYAVMSGPEQFHIVARREDTAFLTKHLRVYGGSGEYDGCKLGRLLKNITFCGKGYVDKPANPFSVIFNSPIAFNAISASKENPFKRQNGVFISCSSTDNFDNKLEKSKMTVTVEELQAQNTDLQKTINTLQADKTTTASTVESLQNRISDLEEKLRTSEKTNTDISSAKEQLEKTVSEVTAAKKVLEDQLAKIEAEKIIANRISILVEGGYTKDDAANKVSIFANLTDDQFKIVADELVNAKKAVPSDEEDEEKKEGKDGKCKSTEEDSTVDDQSVDPAGEANANVDTLKNVQQTVEPNLTVNAPAPNSDDDTKALRDELRQVLSSRLHYGKDNENDADQDDEE